MRFGGWMSGGAVVVCRQVFTAWPIVVPTWHTETLDATQLLIGMEADVVDKEKAQALVVEAEEPAKMIRGLIKYFEPKGA